MAMLQMMRRFAAGTAARRGGAVLAVATASRSCTLRMISSSSSSSSSSRQVSSSSSTTTAPNAAAVASGGGGGGGGGTTTTASPPPGQQRPWCHDTIHRALLNVFASASASSVHDNNDYVISTNRYELERHGHGESYHSTAPPDFVVAPTTMDDITAVLHIARQYRLPVIPFGAGTSVEGHVQAVRGGISLDMKHFHSIEYDADHTPHLVRVGAGVTRRQLQEALRHTGYHFPIDPGAIDATLGGMMATAASGTTAVRYGTMRENILSCQCVFADGTVVRAGTDAVKNAAGYNLVGLMTGSEGTLGVITHLTVQLRPVLEHRISAVVGFATLHDAAHVAWQLKMHEIPIYRCELLDAASVQAYNDYSHQSLPVRPTVFLEFQSYSDASVQEQVQLTRDVLCADSSAAAVSFECGTDHETLWAARHSLYYAAIAARPHATGAIVTDACVPLTRLADLLTATVADVQASNVVGPCFGHAGDGNLHCILPVRPDEDVATGYWDRVVGVRDRLAERAMAAGGTVTGEHGVGMGKMYLLERQYGPGAVAMMRAIKHALDPLNIMNPGKVLPPVPNDGPEPVEKLTRIIGRGD